jgi:hypothetical protein
MKKMLLMLITASFLLASSVFADYFRVFYYVEGKNISFDEHGNQKFERPFKYTTEAKTKGAAFDELMKEVPNAIHVTIYDLFGTGK